MDKAELYVDDAGEWRWVRMAANREIVGASTEGYKNEIEARENYERGNTGPDTPKLEKENEAE
jgi:uncharacterized protein YegP (UPF0339 family)